METRRIDCLLNIQPIIDYTHQDIRHGADDARPARRAHDHKQLTVFQYDRRGHGAERTLSWRNGFSSPRNKAVAVGNTGFGSEFILFVVQKDADFARRNARAKAIVESCGYGHGISL